MLSSMTPTILAKDGELVAVIGSPGGRTIINTVLNIVLAHIDFRMSPEASIAAGRTHHQWLPDRLNIEGGAFTLQAVRVLEEMGHTVRMQGTQGIANSIFIDPATDERVGVPDPRNPDGRAAGY
jgi:gamma-glutamyltranspeptidase/glutathione hydrolase